MKKIIFIIYLKFIFIPPVFGKTLELVTLEYPPYQYTEDKEIKGVVVDIIEEAFHRMNQTINISVIPWARAISMIEHGKSDAIFTVYSNSQRELFADYSKEVLMYQSTSLFVKKNSPIKFNGSIDKLKKYRFGTIFKVSYGKKFDNAKHNKVITNIVKNTSVKQNILMLIHGRIDIWINNTYGGIFELKKLNLTDSVIHLSPAIEKIPSYIAFSKKRKLSVYRDQFDIVLSQMKMEGIYEKIIQSYLKKYITEKGRRIP